MSVGTSNWLKYLILSPDLHLFWIRYCWSRKFYFHHLSITHVINSNYLRYCLRRLKWGGKEKDSNTALRFICTFNYGSRAANEILISIINMHTHSCQPLVNKVSKYRYAHWRPIVLAIYSAGRREMRTKQKHHHRNM